VAGVAGAAQGLSPCFVVVDGQLAALLLLGDKPRPEAAEAIARLQRQGLACAMMTGDSAVAAAAVACQLGIPTAEVRAAARLLPLAGCLPACLAGWVAG
jgi:P-type E1-E2 ATPase